MGGCAGRSANYKEEAANNSMISHRMIPNEDDTPVHHHSVGGVACGYGFNINEDEIEKNMEGHLLAKRKQEQMDKIEEITPLYQNMLKYYKEHDLDHCYKLVQQLTELYRLIDFSLVEDLSPGEKKDIEVFVEKIKEEHQELLSFEQEIDRGGWIFKSQSKGMTISSRHEKDTVGILVESIIDVPVEIFLSVVSQMELYKEFVPFISESKEEKMIDRNHKIGNCIANFPLLSKREAFFQGIGYNRLNHNNSIFMYSRSLHNRPDLCEKLDYTPVLNKDYVQIEFKYLVVKYEPIDLKSGKASLAINIDMKLNFIPLSILDYACQTFGQEFFINLMKVSKKFQGSIWEERIKQNPETFNFFKSIITEYYQKKHP